MRRSNLFLFLLIPFLAAFSLGQSRFPAVAASNVPRISKPSRTVSLPLVFEANRGQADGGVDFIAQVRGYRAGISASRVILGLNRPSEDAVAMDLAGANRDARPRGEDKLPGHSNYLIGSDPAKWITGVEQYARVRYADIYPGIDLVFHGNQERLENDFVLHPGATAGQIGLTFSAMARHELRSNGDLLWLTPRRAMRLAKPRAYQVIGGKEVEVAAAYAVRKGRIGFRLGRYDRRRVLVIDPVLVFATYWGGAPGPQGVNQVLNSVATDTAGNVYVTGSTDSTSFPVTPGALQTTPAFTQTIGHEAFVSKLDPTGQTLIFSTYISGISDSACPGCTAGVGLVLDSSDNIYIAGGGQPGLPIPAGSNPFQASVKTLAILKLNSSGTAVLNATYLGGSGLDVLGGLAIDSADHIYLTGITSSNDFPLQNPLQGTLGTSKENAFVTELNSTLEALIYSTYLGENTSVAQLGIQSLAIDSSGDAYVTGQASSGFPTTANAYQATCSETCPFLAKLNWNGSALSLLYATYLGQNQDQASAVQVDASQNVYLAGIAGFVSSFPNPTFPVVSPIEPCSATSEQYGTPVANFLSEFNSSGALIFSTCLGVQLGADGDIFPVLALDTSGNVYLAAVAQAGLPLKNPIDANPPATNDSRLFVSEVSAVSHLLSFSSFVAGAYALGMNPQLANQGESPSGLAVDSSGNIDLVGESIPGILNGSSTAYYSFFPVFNAMQPYFAGPQTMACGDFGCYYSTGFIMKISPSAGAAAALVPAELQFPTTGVATTSAPLSTTVYNLGTDTLTVSNVAVSANFVIQSNNCTTVAPSGGSCMIQVASAPTATGTNNGTLTITDNSAGSPHTVALTGQGATTNLTVSPTSLKFASQATGTTSPAQTVTLTAGVDAVNNFRIQISGDFAETNNCGGGIAANAKCEIQVSFTPKTATAAALDPRTSRLWMWAFLIAGWIILPSGMSTKRLARRYLPLLALLPVIFLLSCGGGNTNGTPAGGTFTGTLTITNSAPNSPQTVSLSGT